MSDLISVIIPAFNAEKTIGRCIKSIQNQTYSNLEIIVVNDGSKDNTLEILNALSEKDKRLKVLSIPNGGVSHARNIGIDNATGNYITFVDSDDTIEDTMYEYLLGLIKEYDVKIAHCSYSNYSDDGPISYVGNQGKLILQNHEEALESLLEGKYFAGGLWNKLFAVELFDDIRLDEGLKINEDVLANYFLFSKVERSIYSDLCLYNYYQYTNSSTSTTNIKKICQDSFLVAKIMYKYSKGSRYEKSALDCLARNEFALLKNCCYNNHKEKKEMKNNIRKYLKLNCYSSKKQLIAVHLLLNCFGLFRLSYFLYEKIRPAKYDPVQ